MRTTTGVQCLGGGPNECVDTTGLTNVRTFAVGHVHACGLTDTGEVHCSGDDGDGRLGVLERYAGVPQRARVEGSFLAVDTAGSRTCAITSPERAVLCWGRPFRHDAERSTEPRRVPGLDRPALAIAVGVEHACALLEGDSIRCWGGDNMSGELGNRRAAYVPRPRQLSQLATAPRPRRPT